ncbi:MAG: hypothetical protein ACYC6A_24195 [Armatimonadota bacterium]
MLAAGRRNGSYKQTLLTIAGMRLLDEMSRDDMEKELKRLKRLTVDEIKSYLKAREQKG